MNLRDGFGFYSVLDGGDKVENYVEVRSCSEMAEVLGPELYGYVKRHSPAWFGWKRKDADRVGDVTERTFLAILFESQDVGIIIDLDRRFAEELLRTGLSVITDMAGKVSSATVETAVVNKYEKTPELPANNTGS